MKIIIEIEDEQEAKLILKSKDMACALFEIVRNGWRSFKHTDYDYTPAWDKINEILDEHNINVDELID